MIYVMLAISGGLGAVCRFLVAKIFSNRLNAFYIPTLIVNIIGSFFIGMTLQILVNHPTISAVVATGFLGGFTTFSTFAFDAIKLMQLQRLSTALIYVVTTFFLSFLAVGCGYLLF